VLRSDFLQHHAIHRARGYRAARVGVLLKAKEQAMISSFSGAVDEMRNNGIFYHSALVARLTKLAGE